MIGFIFIGYMLNFLTPASITFMMIFSAPYIIESLLIVYLVGIKCEFTAAYNLSDSEIQKDLTESLI